jgi:peptidylprolyl isomerase
MTGEPGTVSATTTSGEFSTVSDAVKSRPTGKAKTGRPAPAKSTRPTSTKAERRAAFRAARAAAARRRQRLKIAAWAGGVALVLAVAVYLVVGANDGPTSPAAAAPCGGAAFPPVPAGADPALCSKPTVDAGPGDVTELKVTTLVDGKGAAAAAGQNITVNYVGVSYRTGVEFDASWRRSQPYSFRLGDREVIPGWDQGLAGIKVGSRVQLDIPSSLAYGDNPDRGPGGPLRFVVDVLAVG